MLTDARSIHVPRYESLTKDACLEFARADDVVARYLPDYLEDGNTNKGFVVTVLSTIKPEEFMKFVKEAIVERDLKAATVDHGVIMVNGYIASKLMGSSHKSGKYDFKRLFSFFTCLFCFI